MEAGLCNTFTGHFNIKEHKVINDITRFNNKSQMIIQMIIQIPGKTSKFLYFLEHFQVSILPTGHLGRPTHNLHLASLSGGEFHRHHGYSNNDDGREHRGGGWR